MLRLSFIRRPRGMLRRLPWVPWIIAIAAAAFGGWIFREQEKSPLILRVNRTFQDWVLVMGRIPVRPPVPVTLVEMEDAGNWTALDYCLFLKSLPQNNPPVVVLESLPPEGKSAFDRAFNQLAIKQSRLVLPVRLSTEIKKEAVNGWWLGGWKAENPPSSMTRFRSIEAGPPEMLRGTVAGGAVNLPTQGSDEVPRAGLYYLLEDDYVPSLVLRAALLAWKISPEQLQIKSGLTISGRRILADADGAIELDPSFLPGMRRLASSDFLLRLNKDSPVETTAVGVSSELLQGVIVLGDLSENAQAYSTRAGGKITRAEMIAAGISTICNGPVVAPAGLKINLLVLALSALTPCLFARLRLKYMWVALPIVIGVYLFACIWLAKERALGLSLFMPVSVLLIGFGLNHLAKTFRKKKI